MNLSIFTGVPKQAKDLIWDIFFASRQRGIDFPTHFPWIDQTAGTYCLTMSKKKDNLVVAALVLRELNLPFGIRCAMIGMVCINQAWRGQSLSTQLLNNVINFASEKKINSLLLWTTQPGIYSRHGFIPDTETSDTFGQVNIESLRTCAGVKFNKVNPKITCGLPPFGKQLINFKSHAAEIITVEIADGIALADWQGSPPSVVDLIEAALPSTWKLNAPSDAAIFDELNKRGHIYASLPCAKRMVLHLGAPVSMPYISILERI
jgi:predicted GNAT family N-acyltransferase